MSSEAVASAKVPPWVTKPKKAGEIILRGNGPRIFGPFRFRPGGYVWRFYQYSDPPFGFNRTSLVVSLESRAGDVGGGTYQLLSNTSARKGQNLVVVNGRLYVDVSSSANRFVMRFTPR